MYPSELGKASRRTPRMDRRIERIVKLLGQSPMTVPQIAAALFCSPDCARRYVRLMYEAKPKRVYVSGWLPVEGNKPTKIYSLGNHKDVTYARKKDKVAVTTACEDKERLLGFLVLPQTVKQLAVRAKLSTSWTRALVTALKKEGKVYIKAWLLPAIKGSQASVFAVGNKPDAVRVRRARNAKRAEATKAKKAKNVFSTMQQQPSPECAGKKYAHWSDEPVRIFRPAA